MSTKKHSERRFKALVTGTSYLIPILFVALIISLIVSSWPSIHTFGWHFLWSIDWDPVNEKFGAGTAVIGTLLSAIIAILIALPLSTGTAMLITQILPPSIGQPLSRVIELMAGIPSIIYGMWGLFIMAPFLANHVQPGLINTFANIPVLNFIFGGMPIGISLFSAGLLLAFMILPLIASTMRDVLQTVPPLIREAAYGVGANRYEVCKHILIRYTRSGLFGATILGLGRALGETMAVTFVIGNAHNLPTGLFMPGTTISATIANEFTEATSNLYSSALIELGLVLLAISFITLFISRSILKHAQTRGGSQ